MGYRWLNPRIQDKGDEVDVYYQDSDGSAARFSYFRTLAACQLAMQAKIDRAKAEKDNLDKYR